MKINSDFKDLLRNLNAAGLGPTLDIRVHPDEQNAAAVDEEDARNLKRE